MIWVAADVFDLSNYYSAPSASQQFEGRGADDLNNELTQMMTRILSNTPAISSSASSAAGINLSKLCIIPGQQCWILYVDALVLDYGGNLMDAIFMGTRAAIFDTRIPKTEVQDLGDGQFEFEVLDDAEDTDIVEGREDMPICVTLNKVRNGKTILFRMVKQELRTKLIIDDFFLFISRSEHVTLWMLHRWKSCVQRPSSLSLSTDQASFVDCKRDRTVVSSQVCFSR